MALLSDININIAKVVPKLKGENNYQIWLESLEIALRSKDPIYWNILRGVSTPPERPAFYSVLHEDVIITLPATATEEQINNTVTEHQACNNSMLETFEEEHSHWNMANYSVLSTLRSTLDSGPQAQLTNMRSA